MRARLTRLHRRCEGSILLLSLAVFGLMLIPMIGILYYASLASTATTAAQGVANSAAYMGLARALDAGATLNTGQPQLYTFGDSRHVAAANEARAAADYTWSVLGVRQALPGSNVALVDLPLWGAYAQPTGGTSTSVLGVVNVMSAPDAAYQLSGNDCSAGTLGYKQQSGASGPITCWVDQRAIYLNSGLGRNAVGRGYDHYSSGVETRANVQLPSIAGFTPAVPHFGGVAGFAQPCVAGEDCAQ